MVHVISFDSATKSLAVSIVYYNLTLANDIQAAYINYTEKKQDLGVISNSNINILLQLYIALLDLVVKLNKDKIQIKMLNITDLIPGKKLADTTAAYRTSALYDYLTNTLDPLLTYNKQDCLFLLEFQMGPNVKSGTISSQIMYHLMKYHNVEKDNIKLIGPSLKNKVVIGGNDSAYSAFIERYKTNYACNKAHAKYNFYKLLEFLDNKHLINNINKKNHDDIADSVLMGTAYILKNFEI